MDATDKRIPFDKATAGEGAVIVDVDLAGGEFVERNNFDPRVVGDPAEVEGETVG